MSYSKSIILLKKKRGLLDIRREILFNETVYNPRDTYATSLKASGLFGLVVPLCGVWGQGWGAKQQSRKMVEEEKKEKRMPGTEAAP